MLLPQPKPETDMTTAEIMDLIRMEIEEHSSMCECRPSDRIAEVDEYTDLILPLTDRIMDRYTPYHLTYYSEATTG